jgi:hypothetical protein
MRVIRDRRFVSQFVSGDENEETTVEGLVRAIDNIAAVARRMLDSGDGI